jgi:hypothetical protein
MLGTQNIKPSQLMVPSFGAVEMVEPPVDKPP